MADGSMDQRDPREAVGVSRSTAHRSLRELEDAGLVRGTDDGEYRLTQFGSLARRRHDEYVARRDAPSRGRSVRLSSPEGNRRA